MVVSMVALKVAPMVCVRVDWKVKQWVVWLVDVKDNEMVVPMVVWWVVVLVDQ